VPVEQEADPDLQWKGQGKAAADACVERGREMSRSIRIWEFVLRLQEVGTHSATDASVESGMKGRSWACSVLP